MNSVFNFVIISIQPILTRIIKSYGLFPDTIINIKELSIVKKTNQEYFQNKMENLNDSFLSFQILLSNLSDFENGGVCFEDGITQILEQGSVFVYSNLMKHYEVPVTRGIQYVLVAKLDVKMNI